MLLPQVALFILELSSMALWILCSFTSHRNPVPNLITLSARWMLEFILTFGDFTIFFHPFLDYHPHFLTSFYVNRISLLWTLIVLMLVLIDFNTSEQWGWVVAFSFIAVVWTMKACHFFFFTVEMLNLGSSLYAGQY